MKKAWALSYTLSAQQRLWSDWMDAQADLSLCWAHMPFYYTPRKLCLWGGILFSCCPSVFPCVCPSMTFWVFFNILKRQWWKFIKFCRHIDIDSMYVYNRKLRLGTNSVVVIALCNSYCCIGSAHTGNSTCSTAFTETSWYFVYTM